MDDCGRAAVPNVRLTTTAQTHFSSPSPLENHRMSRKKTTEPPAASPWYRMADMTALFDVCERQIYRWVGEGKLPRPVKRGRKWSRWPRKIVDELLQQWVASAT
jgi:predicted DNA-binding transcriptional regulator AlpA